MGKCRDELRAGDPIQCPDGTWCMWSGDVPRMWGSAELTMRSEVSARLGSLDRALELMAGGAARWDTLATQHPDLHRALTRRLKTYTAPPPPPAVPVDHKAKQAALREARLEREAAAREAAARREAAAKVGRESQKAAAAAREGERRAAAIEAQREREAIREARRQAAAERKRQAQRERRAKQAALREARLERETAKKQERKAIREQERQQAQEAARAAQAELDHKILAIYRLFGSKNRAAHYCQCSPSRVNDAMRRLDAAQIPKRVPSLAEVRHVMGTLQVDATTTSRALAAAARLHKLKDKKP